ncbi:MAG: Bro-N domain-containing protein [Bacilli bacterium]|nr:Bro-N domain-containing protein [Bacilli bacterium]
MESKIKLFEDKKVRVSWNDEEQDWYFSVVDVVSVLNECEYQTARKYWSVLKTRLKQEGNESTTICSQLKMESPDGKKYLTDVANAEGILRIIQSIPSKKAEPFKMWLAKVGSERLNEISDPELAMQRAMDYYKKKGYSDEWIYQRLLSIKIRHELTDEWKERGVSSSKEYAILTDEIFKSWSDLSVKEYKNIKGLKKENLRDNMTDLELVLTMLSEASTKEISKSVKPNGLDQNISVAKMGGSVAKNARKEIESKTGKSVISSKLIK